MGTLLPERNTLTTGNLPGFISLFIYSSSTCWQGITLFCPVKPGPAGCVPASSQYSAKNHFQVPSLHLSQQFTPITGSWALLLFLVSPCSLGSCGAFDALGGSELNGCCGRCAGSTRRNGMVQLILGGSPHHIPPCPGHRWFPKFWVGPSLVGGAQGGNVAGGDFPASLVRIKPRKRGRMSCSLCWSGTRVKNSPVAHQRVSVQDGKGTATGLDPKYPSSVTHGGWWHAALGGLVPSSSPFCGAPSPSCCFCHGAFASSHSKFSPSCCSVSILNPKALCFRGGTKVVRV